MFAPHTDSYQHVIFYRDLLCQGKVRGQTSLSQILGILFVLAFVLLTRKETGAGGITSAWTVLNKTTLNQSSTSLTPVSYF